MKRLFCSLFVLILLCTGCGSKPENNSERFHIVTSFYPMQVITMNVTKDIPSFAVSCLAPLTAGCLHDYSLSTSDYKTLETADAIIINGGGMESFVSELPENQVIDASQGISFLTDQSGASNSHIWLSPNNVIMEANNICQALSALCPKEAEALRTNTDAFIEKLNALDAEITDALAPYQGTEIVTFHEAFDYFADRYGLTVAATITIEPDDPPSAGELKAVVDTVKNRNVRAIFSEPQYSSQTAESISDQTGVPLYELNPIVSGREDPEAYFTLMRENITVLEAALGGNV